MSSPTASRAAKTATKTATKQIVPPRRYTIGELLTLKKTLPYVSCPLGSFKPDAWRENLVKKDVSSVRSSGQRDPDKNQIKALLIDGRYASINRISPATPELNLPFAVHPAPPPRVSPVPVDPLNIPELATSAGIQTTQQTRPVLQPVPFAGSLFPQSPPTERRRPPELGKYPPNYPVPNRQPSLAQRQPLNPGQAENRGFQQQPQQPSLRNYADQQQQFVHLYGAPGMEYMEGPPAPRAASFAGVDPRAYTAYAMQQNRLRLLQAQQALERLNLQGLQSPTHAAAPIGRTPFEIYSASSGYGNVTSPTPGYGNLQASQGFVPGGNLKTAATTGLTPNNEYTGISWETSTPVSPVRQQQQDRDNWGTTENRDAYYGHVGQQAGQNVNKENFLSGSANDGRGAHQQYPAKREAPSRVYEPAPQVELLGLVNAYAE